MIKMEVKVDRFVLHILENEVKTLPSKSIQRLQRLILATAIDIQQQTKALITHGPVRTGRAYKRPGGRVHIASARGEPAKNDHGDLVNSIEVKQTPMSVQVGSIVNHGLYTEKGTPKMAARPWLMPTVEASRPALEKRIAALLEDL